jgi:hypothetical protein
VFSKTKLSVTETDVHVMIQSGWTVINQKAGKLLLLLLLLLFLRCSSAARSVNSFAEMSASPKYKPSTLLTQFQSFPEKGNNNTLTETKHTSDTYKRGRTTLQSH